MRRVAPFLASMLVLVPLAAAADAPDLRPWIKDLWPTPSPAEGDVVSVRAYVYNEGTARSDAFYLRMDVDGTQVLYGEASGMNAGTSSFFLGNQFTVTPGVHTVTFAVDVFDTVAESDESDNLAVYTFSVLPDLVPSASVPTHAAPGDIVDLAAAVGNTGKASAAGFLVRLRVDGSTLAEEHVDGLARSAEHAGPVATWTATPGFHTIEVAADVGESIDEESEGNNVVTLVLPVGEPPTAPTNVAARHGPALGTAVVTWDAPANDGGLPVERYTVYREDEGAYAFVASVTADARSAEDPEARRGTNTYVVTASNAVGESPFSAPASVEVLRAGPEDADRLSAGPASWQWTREGDGTCPGNGWSSRSAEAALTTEGTSVYARAESQCHAWNDGHSEGEHRELTVRAARRAHGSEGPFLVWQWWGSAERYGDDEHRACNSWASLSGPFVVLGCPSPDGSPPPLLP